MAQYFSSSSKKGEIGELNEALNSTNMDRKREALYKTIAQMTIGKDVSTLFQSVIKCLEHPDIELKKLVYLYIINYSRNKPDDAIMVINLFRKDVLQGTPLIRALAVRTMGCIRVKKLNEYLADPLKDAISNDDAYVKKTAVLCVPKVFELNPELVENAGLIQKMQKMLTTEHNAIIVANLVLSLYECSVIKGKNYLTITPHILQRLLLSLNECMEWGQVFILDCLVNYIPVDSNEADSIIDRILPRLSHINPSVVFSAIKVIIKFMDYLNNPETIRLLCKKLTPSLVTLVSFKQPEIQYTILRNVSFILQKRPRILEKEIKVFFCKFNDPYYIKLEKLEILVRLCDQKNYEVVVNELSEYANEVDPDFVRRSIKAIGKIAIKFDKSVDAIIKILVNLVKSAKANPAGSEHIIEEAIQVFQNIYRKYPDKVSVNNSLSEIWEVFELVSSNEGKTAAIWIVGEYAEKLEKSIPFIQDRIESFPNEDRYVQLQLLTAAVKIFLKFPDESEAFITKLLQKATDSTDNPDVRDRAYIYWRMLSTDPEKTKVVVLSDKPITKEELFTYETSFLDIMIENIAMVSSLVHMNPEQLFRSKNDLMAQQKTLIEENEKEFQKENSQSPNPAQKEKQKVEEPRASATPLAKEKVVEKKPPVQPNSSDFTDLLDLDVFGGAPTQPKKVVQELVSTYKPQAITMATSTAFPAKTNSNDLLDLLEGGLTSQSKPVSGGLSNFGVSNQEEENDDDDDLAPRTVVKNAAETLFQQSTPVPLELVLSENVPGNFGKTGIKVLASFAKENNILLLNLKIQNTSPQSLDNLEFQMAPNIFALNLDKPAVSSIPSGRVVDLKINLNPNGVLDSRPVKVPLSFSVALKSSYESFAFNIPCMFHVLLNPAGPLSKEMFRNLWKQIPENFELLYEVPNLAKDYKDISKLKEAFNKNNIFFLANRTNDKKQSVLYFSAKSCNNLDFLIEVCVPSLQNPNGCSLSCKSHENSLVPLFLQCSSFILNN